MWPVTYYQSANTHYLFALQFVGYSCCDDFSIEAAQLEGLRGVLYCGLSLRPLCYERAGDRGGEWRWSYHHESR